MKSMNSKPIKPKQNRSSLILLNTFPFGKYILKHETWNAQPPRMGPRTSTKFWTWYFAGYSLLKNTGTYRPIHPQKCILFRANYVFSPWIFWILSFWSFSFSKIGFCPQTFFLSRILVLLHPNPPWTAFVALVILLFYLLHFLVATNCLVTYFYFFRFFLLLDSNLHKLALFSLREKS